MSSLCGFDIFFLRDFRYRSKRTIFLRMPTFLTLANDIKTSFNTSKSVIKNTSIQPFLQGLSKRNSFSSQSIVEQHCECHLCFHPILR